MKKLTAMLLILAMTAGLAGCKTSTPAAEPEPAAENAGQSAEEEQPPVEEAAAGEVKNIGIAIYSMAADSCVGVVEEAKLVAEKYGWTITLLDADGDPATQADQMNTLVSQKVDAIIFNPTDTTSLKPSIEAAVEAGIPVFGVGMEMDDACMSLLVSFAGMDDYTIAAANFEWVAKTYAGTDAKCALISGTAGTDSTNKTEQAMEDVLKDTDIISVGSFDGNYDAAQAMSITEDLLVRNPDLTVIVCQDHVMAGGAASAIADAGKTGEVAVVATVGMSEYLEYVEDGSIDCAAYVLLYKAGGFAVEALHDYFEGSELAEKYYLAPFMATKDNVEDAKNIQFDFNPAK